MTPHDMQHDPTSSAWFRQSHPPVSRSPFPNRRIIHLIAAAVCLVSFVVIPIDPIRGADLRGNLTIAGNGPEQPLFELLARAFERHAPGVYLDLLWDKNSKPAEIVRSGEAQIAVTGTADPELRSTQIAWDGIGIVVHLSNTTKDMTWRQIGELFSGKYSFWSELGGPDTKILLIDRPRYENVRDAFEEQLGIAGKIPNSATTISRDDKVIKKVVGTLPPSSAVSYVSLEQALAAVRSGVAIRLLAIDKIEPEEPTVKDGRYKLRRPVLLLSAKEAPPLVQAFEEFCLSAAGQKIIDELYTPLGAESKS
ncbi:MAG: substrate-binding domain-containing protein [Nitrospiraceae bacterium]